MPSNHKADKPWDTPDIDKWKIQPFTPADNLGGTFAAESEFKILFPKYREVYLKEAWPLVTKALQKNGIACTLDLIDGRMSVKTTRKTYDPAAILKARDLVKLLARSVPAPQAIRVLEDGIASDIIKIRNLIRNKERFVKRRQRILGPNGSTLKAIELLTKTFILVHGGTVSVLGSHKSLKEVRRLVEDTIMRNIHPVYFIKRKMIMVELAKDPELVGESWDRFLPSFKPKTLSRRHVPHKVTDKTKKVYTPFPPPMEKSKVDLQIDTGEFFLGKEARERAKLEGRKDRQREAKRERELERAKDFVPGPERGGDEAPKKKKRKRTEKAEE